MKKSLLFVVFLALMLGMFTTMEALTVQIGPDGSTPTTSYFPIYGLYGYNYSQQIYFPSEIGYAANITKLRFWYNSGTITNSRDWVIYMGHTDQTEFDTTTSWIPFSDLTQVFAGDVSSIMTGAAGWKEITLNTAFTYNYTQNLVIAVDENTPGYASMNWGGYASGSDYRGILYYNDYTNPDPEAPPTANYRHETINRIQLEMEVSGYPEAPTNPNPAHNATGVAQSGTLTWDFGADTATYDLWLGPAGAMEQQVFDATAGATGSYSYADLSAFAAYQWQVVAHNTTRATTNGPVWSFVTTGPPISTFPWTESFDTVTAPALPAGWTAIDNNGDGDIWITYTTNPLSPPNCAMLYTDYNTSNDDYLVTPPIALTGNQWLKFWTRAQSTGEPDEISILLSTTTPTADAFTNVLMASTPVNFTTYTEFTVDLRAYSGTCYISFTRKDPPADGWRLYVDNISIEDIPAVIPPSDLTVSNVTTDSADLGWTENNIPPVTQWDIVYGAPGFDPDTATPVSVTDNPYTLGGLNDSTTYDWYVRADNGETKAVSSWAGPSTFTTNMLPISTFPWTENFDGVTAPALPLGWTKIVQSTSTYAYVETQNTTLSHSLPNRIRMYNSGDTAADLVLISPPIAPALNTLRVRFWAMGSSTGFPLQVGTMDMQGAKATFSMVEQVSLTGTFAEYVIDFDTYLGSDQYIAFRHGLGGTYRTIYIDDVLIDAIPTSPIFTIDPTSTNFMNVLVGSTVSQTFTVTNTGLGSLEIVSVEKTDGDLDYFAITNNTYTDPLGPGDFFTFDVEFTPTAVANYTVTVTVTDDQTKTPHDVIITGNGHDPTVYFFPWTEDFETWPPLDWDLTGGTYSFVQYTATGGNNWARANFWSQSAGNTDVMTTPPLHPEYNTSLQFTWSHQYNASYPNDALTVQISNDYTTWTPLWYKTGADFNSGDGAGSTTPGTGVQESILIPEEYANTTFYIQFYAYSGWGPDLFIDDVIISRHYDIPAGEPTDLGEGVTVTSELDLDIVPADIYDPALAILPNYDDLDPDQTLVYGFTGSGIGDLAFYIDATGNWYGVLIVGGHVYIGDPNPLSGPGTITFYNVNFDAKGDAIALFSPDINPTLPVELSSFTATLTAEMFVQIAWVAQSETNHLGYNILRGESGDAEDALKLNDSIISEGTALGSQISYSYLDSEVEMETTYYYWLESVDLGGTSALHGPITVLVSGEPGDPGIPPLPPTVTQLLPAFPNPFNPSTNIRYSLVEPAKVKIEIFNVKGQLMRVFENTYEIPGYYQISWDGMDSNGRKAASGVYLYRMTAGKYSSYKKMVLAK